MTPEHELPTSALPTTPRPTIPRPTTMRPTAAPLTTPNITTGHRTTPTAVSQDDKKTDAGTKSEEEEEKEPFLGLKSTQVIGGILASSTAAVLGGQLGVAGTVVGAALTSFTIVVGGAIYTRTFDKTKEGLGSAVSRLRVAGTPPATPPEDSDYAVPEDDPTRVIAAQAMAKDDAETVLPWHQRIAPIKVLVAAAGLFLIAAVVVTGLESLRGSSVSGGDGTTIGQISRGQVESTNTDGNGGDRTGESRDSDNAPVVEPTAQPSSTTSTQPTTEPTTEPTSNPTTDPTTQPTTGPTTAPTTEPTTAPTTAPTAGPGTGNGSQPGSGTGTGTESDTGSPSTTR